VWKYIHLSSLNEYYFDSSNPSLKLNSIYNQIFLLGNTKFTDYRFVEGAEEIIIDVEPSFSSDEDKFIIVEVSSYSVRSNTKKTVSSKK
jgi:hypothetical protein